MFWQSENSNETILVIFKHCERFCSSSFGPFDIFRLAECHWLCGRHEIAIPFNCKAAKMGLTLSKEEEELFEVKKKNELVLKIILESDEESAWGAD